MQNIQNMIFLKEKCKQTPADLFSWILQQNIPYTILVLIGRDCNSARKKIEILLF